MGFTALSRLIVTGAGLAWTVGGSVRAQETADAPVGRAVDGQLGLQPAASPVMEKLSGFHDSLLVIITLITLLVFVLLGICIVRFRKSANPTPAKTSHNTWLEVAWTAIPVAILVFIMFPSFNLLYFQDQTPKADLVIKATGYQWYWGYEYPEQDNGADGVTIEEPFGFDAFMIDDDLFGANADSAARADALADLQTFLNTDQTPEIHRLLDTNTRIVVPVDTTVKFLVTSADVLHSFTVPSFGFKIDAIPGRFNETWFRADRVGTYYGQCSELCGIKHAFMPIAVEVVSKPQFAAWKDRTTREYALRDAGTRFADASAGPGNE
ncbi:cytochrome c oxidase subunit II [Rhodothalassium salexigens]|uniref:cytochrome c oxidase subunit II n=1 Tax=Rhodothalassium salexigens TaxID=1086 RepID=UPI0019147378|nr:cytochrome c oxidase subunit II [Rhodothalassium salexigens]MBK5912468.1 cytochrome c oxidase subunit II [Rhodothalassium salexigens]MBK5920653.1 cytochrome c oxidase subunit II [Rhodothalassium salexigens]